MLKSLETYWLYKLPPEHNRISKKYFLGGVLIGGLSAYVVTELRKVKGGSLSDNKEGEEFLGVGRALTFSTSAVLIALGLSNMQLTRRHIMRAVNHYNWVVHRVGQKEQSYLELNLAGNGVE